MLTLLYYLCIESLPDNATLGGDIRIQSFNHITAPCSVSSPEEGAFKAAPGQVTKLDLEFAMRDTTFTLPHKELRLISDKPKELAMWYMLKALYKKNTVIYNFSYASLAREVNISLPTLRKYIPVLLDMGWVRLKDGHMVISSFNKVTGSRRRDSSHIILTGKDTFNNVLDKVRAMTIEADCKHQQFMVNLKSSIVTKAQLRKISKLRRKYDVTPEVELAPEDEKLILTSTDTVGRRLSMSRAGAHRLMKRLDRDKVIRLTPVYEELKKEFLLSYEPEVYHEIVKLSGNRFRKREGVLLIKGDKLILSRGHSITLLPQ